MSANPCSNVERASIRLPEKKLAGVLCITCNAWYFRLVKWKWARDWGRGSGNWPRFSLSLETTCTYRVKDELGLFVLQKGWNVECRVQKRTGESVCCWLPGVDHQQIKQHCRAVPKWWRRWMKKKREGHNERISMKTPGGSSGVPVEYTEINTQTHVCWA